MTSSKDNLQDLKSWATKERPSYDFLKEQSSGSQKQGNKGKAPELKVQVDSQYIDTMIREVVDIEDVDAVRSPEQVAQIFICPTLMIYQFISLK